MIAGFLFSLQGILYIIAGISLLVPCFTLYRNVCNKPITVELCSKKIDNVLPSVFQEGFHHFALVCFYPEWFPPPEPPFQLPEDTDLHCAQVSIDYYPYTPGYTTLIINTYRSRWCKLGVCCRILIYTTFIVELNGFLIQLTSSFLLAATTPHFALPLCEF